MKPKDFIIPCVLAAVLLLGAVKRVNVFDTFVEGAREGIGTAVKILPALVALMTAVGMFRASGALELLTGALEPVLASIGIPPEVVPLAMLRPVTGSGAMALFDGILREHGADSFVGRVASVLQGSTETTFYTVAVYYGSVGIKRTRHTVPSAMTADVAGLLLSVLTVRMMLGS